jgi:hypothetical protein
VSLQLLTLWILHSIKTDITALNSIIKYSLGITVNFGSRLFKKTINYIKNAGDRFPGKTQM